MLRSDHATLVDIKSAIASQNTTLQRITKTLTETFSKISSYKPLLQPRSATSAATPAGSPPLIASVTTTAVGTISAAAHITFQTLLPATIVNSMTSSPSSTPTATTKTLTTLSLSTPQQIQPAPPQTSPPSIYELPLTSPTSKPTPPRSASLTSLKTATAAATLLPAAPPTSTNDAPPITSPIPPPMLSPSPNNFKTWPLHVLQVYESQEKEIKCTFSSARNLFDKIIKPTELSFKTTEYETSSSIVSIYYLNDLLVCMVIVGRKYVFNFDPGGHGLRYNEAASSRANSVLANFSQGMNQMKEYRRTIESPAEEIKVFYGFDWDTKGFKCRIPMVLLDKTYTSLEDLYTKSIWNLENLPRLLDSMLAFKSGDMSGVSTSWWYTGMHFSLCCWHVVVYHLDPTYNLHLSASKFWYVVPIKNFLKFEMILKKCFPDLFEKQPNLLQREDWNKKFILHVSSSLDGPLSICFDFSLHSAALQHTEVKDFGLYGLFNLDIPEDSSYRVYQSIQYLAVHGEKFTSGFFCSNIVEITNFLACWNKENQFVFDPRGHTFDVKGVAIWSKHVEWPNTNICDKKMLNKFYKCIFDLEDKVVFEGSVMIRYWLDNDIGHNKNATRPRRDICTPSSDKY